MNWRMLGFKYVVHKNIRNIHRHVNSNAILYTCCSLASIAFDYLMRVIKNLIISLHGNFKFCDSKWWWLEFPQIFNRNRWPFNNDENSGRCDKNMMSNRNGMFTIFHIKRPRGKGISNLYEEWPHHVIYI